MSMTFRPTTHAERDQVVAAVQTLLSDTSADPMLLTLCTAVLVPTMTAYVAARAALPEKYAAARAASDAADAADADFDRDLRLLSASVRDSHGRNQPRLLADMIGGLLPSALTRLSYREEINKGNTLLTNLKGRADLGVNPDRISAFETSLTALQFAVLADEVASRDSTRAGAEQREAGVAFDLAYSRLLRALRGYLGESAMAAILPRFVRADDEEPTEVGKALPTLPLEPEAGGSPA